MARLSKDSDFEDKETEMLFSVELFAQARQWKWM